MRTNPEARAKVQSRVKRISGQIAAGRSALDALGVELLHGHVEHCVVGHGTDGDAHPNPKPMSQEELLTELP